MARIGPGGLAGHLDYLSDDSPDAAQRLKDEIEEKASRLLEHPKLYKAGRVSGTREMVVRTNHVVVYSENANAVSILRVLHVARQWPPGRATSSSDLP